jgi:hypothetical protein
VAGRKLEKGLARSTRSGDATKTQMRSPAQSWLELLSRGSRKFKEARSLSYRDALVLFASGASPSRPAAVEDGGGGLLIAPRGQPQHRAQIARESLKTPRRHPALCLLIDGRPRRKIVGHGAPGNALADQTTQPVEKLAQGMLPLRRILAHQRAPPGSGPRMTISPQRCPRSASLRPLRPMET